MAEDVVGVEEEEGDGAEEDMATIRDTVIIKDMETTKDTTAIKDMGTIKDTTTIRDMETIVMIIKDMAMIKKMVVGTGTTVMVVAGEAGVGVIVELGMKEAEGEVEGEVMAEAVEGWVGVEGATRLE